jgi:hypothetical protein
MHTALFLLISLAQGQSDRELSTDRPDKTESPYTVPAGRWQVEIDAVTYARQDLGVVARHAWEVGASTLKRGLGNRMDVQLLVVPFRREVLENPLRTVESGTGEFVGRFKFNVFGADSGRAALALMPFASLTPGANGRVLEGGLIIPLAIELAPGWGLGTMFETDFVEIEGLNGRRPVIVYSATVGRDLSTALGAYAEIFTAFTPAMSTDRWNATLDFGMTLGLGSDLQLDGGINFGLTSSADDFNPFLGVSIRF